MGDVEGSSRAQTMAGKGSGRMIRVRVGFGRVIIRAKPGKVKLIFYQIY